MAYDPKDKADKALVDKLISDAVDAALSDAVKEHDADKAGLVTKNRELIKKNKALSEGKDGDPEEVARLESALDAAKKEAKDAAKAAKDAAKERDTFKQTAETETAASRKLLVEGGLTDALVANNVGKQFIPAARALLQGQVSIKQDGDNRIAMVGDKPLSEFVKTWSQSDDGKSFVAAPANGGGNAPGGSANGSGKTMARSAFTGMNPASQAAYMKEGGTLTD